VIFLLPKIKHPAGLENLRDVCADRSFLFGVCHINIGAAARTGSKGNIE
jgi:hypothetical protein